MFCYHITFALLILGIQVLCSIPDRNIVKYGDTEKSVITIHGQFNHEYRENVDQNHGIIIVYNYNETINAVSKAAGEKVPWITII